MLVVENQLIRFFCKIGGSSGKSGDLATLTHRPRGLYSFVQFESRFGLGNSFCSCRSFVRSSVRRIAPRRSYVCTVFARSAQVSIT